MEVMTDLHILYFFAWVFDSGYFFVDPYFIDSIKFLENYNISGCFLELHNKNIDVLDFNNYYIMYMVEAKLFLNQQTIFLLESLPFGDFSFDFKVLPALPQEYFLTKTTSMDFKEDVLEFLNKLPDWIIPVELNEGLQLEDFQYLIECDGFVVNRNGEYVGKWTLCIDLQKYFKLGLIIKE